MDFKKDYYKILEVPEDAPTGDIKTSYRRLANKYHPDRNPGKPKFEEITKELNEAKEVLLDDNQRFIYDQYRKSEREEANRLKKEAQETNKKRFDSNETIYDPLGHKKQYVKKKTIITEIRVYVTGIIRIKYYAPQDTERMDHHLKEFYYSIHPTEFAAEINEKDIYRSDVPPASFGDVFNKNEHFPLGGNQPIKTRIVGEHADAYHELKIENLVIPEPDIELVTKHETTSFGTVRGKFYGYVKHLQYHDEYEEVEECFGPTGRKDYKTENGAEFSREEYYQANCTTYWSNWVPRYTSVNSSPKVRTFSSAYRKPVISQDGCVPSTISSIILVIYLLFLLFTIPYLLPGLIFIGLMLLFSWLGRGSSRGRGLASGFVGLFYLLFIVAFLWNLFTQKRTYHPSPLVTETTREKENPTVVPVTNPDNGEPDSLISHFRQWQDYDDSVYSGRYTVRASDVHSAGAFKNSLAVYSNSPQNYDRIIHDIKDHDTIAVTGLYNLFDSIANARPLTQTRFAEMIVSFAQDIPYSLVLENGCDPSLYNDAYIREYLSTSDALCEPNQRFGINSPVEFLAGLKGDCDTRTLLVYLVLSHYHYDVALLSSEQYNHSLIGINLPYSGVTFGYNGQKYVLWETTAAGMRPGVISPKVSDMNYWRISLKSK